MEKSFEIESPFTPAARAFLIKNLGKEWIEQRQFVATRITLRQAREILPWLKQVTEEKQAGE